MSDNTGLSPIVRSIAWRVNLAVWFNRVLGWSGAVLAGAAASLVACKMLWPASAPLALAIVGLLPVVWIQGLVECRRRGLFFTQSEVIEVIDHLYRDDGAVAAAWENEELRDPEALYAAVAGEVRARLPRLDPRYYARKTLAPLALIAAALVVPARPEAALPQSEAILSSLTQPLAEKLAANETILPEETLKELKDEIEALQKDEQGISKEKWEAIEELQQRIDGAVEQSRQDVTATAQALGKLSDMMDASGNIEGNAAEGAEQELLKDLERAMRDSKTQLPSAMRKQIGDVARQMQQAMAAGGAGLSREMRDRMKYLRDKLGQMPGGASDGPGDVGDGTGNGQANKDGNGEGPDGDGAPDSGGINRGRGDAQLTLSREKRAQGAQFKDQEIQNQFITPEDMVDMGITPLAPKPEPGKFSPGTVRQFQAQEGTGVSRTRISPSQKDVIAKYFTGS